MPEPKLLLFVLEADRLDQFVDVDRLFFLDQSVDRHCPRPRLQCVGVDAFAGREFVEVVIAQVDRLRRHVAIERKCRVAFGGIERGGRIGGIGAGATRQRQPAYRGGRAGDEGAAVEKDQFGSGLAGGDLPPAAAVIAHGGPRDVGSGRSSCSGRRPPYPSIRDVAGVCYAGPITLSRLVRIRGRPGSRGRRSTAIRNRR